MPGFALSLRKDLELGLLRKLELFRLWGLLEMDQMHFVLRDGHEPLGAGVEHFHLRICVCVSSCQKGVMMVNFYYQFGLCKECLEN